MSTASLRVIATLTAKIGSEHELRELLLPAVALFRAEPGCEGYLLHEDRKHPGRFTTYEAWVDEHALACHTKSPKMKELAPKMKELLQGELHQDFLSVAGPA